MLSSRFSFSCRARRVCAVTFSLTAVRVPQTDPIITGFLYEAFAYIAKPTHEQTLGDLLGLALKCGEVNIRAMELLNQGHIGLYGKPVPTRVRVCAVELCTS